MRPTRVYKVNLRQNIIRQMLLTDRNILFLTVISITGMVFWLGGSNISFANKLFISLCLSGILIVGSTIKIDGQSLVSILPRIIRYHFKSKKKRY